MGLGRGILSRFPVVALLSARQLVRQDERAEDRRDLGRRAPDGDLRPRGQLNHVAVDVESDGHPQGATDQILPASVAGLDGQGAKPGPPDAATTGN